MSRPIRPGTIGKEATLAERIARERERRGWSYERLATEMTEAGRPMSRDAIHRIEKGRPPRKVSVDELVALMEVFQLEFEDLMTPIELVEQKWAQEIAQEWIEATKGLDDANEALLAAALRLAEVARRSPELEEFVANRWLAAEPARQWWARFSDEVPGHALSALASKSNEFWELMLQVVALQSQGEK